jgi:hypothetical protein
MKQLFLFVVFTGLFLAPAFSQTIWQFKIDATLSARLAFGYQNPFELCDSNDLKLRLKDMPSYNQFNFPKYSGRSFGIGSNSMLSLGQSNTYDRMPCVRPEGYFPMKIVKPDSDVRYSLLIKWY